MTAACGHCFECRGQKARGWQVRMVEEMKTSPNAIFVTLTLNDDSYNKFKKELNTEDDNKIAGRVIRLFLERIRKETKRSIKHWFVTELGHENSKRLHMHGIMWRDDATEMVKKHWNYGHVFIGDYVNEKTIMYITKYMTKSDIDNLGFIGQVFASAGIGRGYINRLDAKNNKYKENGKTNQTYRLPNGRKLNLPTYYKNHIYSEKEKELLWIEKIEEGKIYVCGEIVDADDLTGYEQLLKYHRDKQMRLNKEDPEVWEKAKYIKRLIRQRKAQQKQEEKDREWYIQLMHKERNFVR